MPKERGKCKEESENSQTLAGCNSNNSFTMEAKRTTGPARRSTKGQWTAEEDVILSEAVQRFKGKNWKRIAACFKDRTDVQCLHRWQKVLDPDLIKGPWSKEEDEKIIELVEKFGPKKWSMIAQQLPGRIGKQCRERWHNHLNPAISKEAWSQQEELILIRAHQLYGNKWAELSKFLPGRTDNAIKNHWNSSVKKKLESYMASGLLEQFEDLSHVENVSQPVGLMKGQASGEDGANHKASSEAEERSEYSQESTDVCGSQSGTELGSLLLHTKELQLAEEAHVSEVAPPGAEMASDTRGCSSNCSNQPVVFHASSTSESKDCGLDLQEVLDLSAEHEKGSPACLLISDDECCRSLFSDAITYAGLPAGYHFKSSFNFNGNSDPLLCGSSRGSNNEECLFVSSVSNGIIYVNESTTSPCAAGSSRGRGNQEEELVSAMSHFGPESELLQAAGVDGKLEVHEKQKEMGSLCYEPPRFTGLDVPFLSCDLVQSGGDMQQEYSPLGIRQLMVSSMNCITPFKLWESSPSWDESPDVLLKSMGKTFASTPSILRKRNRDILSPLTDRRLDKKLEIDVALGLTKEFSRLDMVVDEGETNRVPLSSLASDRKGKCGYFKKNDDKENVYPLGGDVPEKRKDLTSCSCNTSSEKDVQLPAGLVIMDKRVDQILVSSDQIDLKPNRGGVGHGPQTPRSRKILGTLSEQAAASQPSTGHSYLIVTSPAIYGKEVVAVTSVQSVPHSVPHAIPPLDKVHAGALSSDLNAENFSIFGGTPFKRSIESPSAWKSPWFFHSFLPGPRIDTEISIEDIGYFASPVEKSYDAISLMRQLSEQTASAYADALEVLGNKTCKKVFKNFCSSSENADQENNQEANNQPESSFHHSSNTECRVLDFSDCETPGKRREEDKTASMQLSSPSSSYLLKRCR